MTSEEVEFEEKLQISALSDGCIYGIKLQLGSGSAFYNHNFFPVCHFSTVCHPNLLDIMNLLACANRGKE